ncbi:hypothetical protein Taro_050743 [Colocasia esculenta]|uniref:Reverse transcriptase zinc-binding domain-containing protein n=1 Tax=Colocasia esculenta TaxID=4460 RepID=A0A843XEK7_COLES|nr:hypothetical protein [Colocasia esculenta]
MPTGPTVAGKDPSLLSEGTSFFSLLGLLVGFAKGMADADSARSPTSPPDCRLFSSFGSHFVRSPRSPGAANGSYLASAATPPSSPPTPVDGHNGCSRTPTPRDNASPIFFLNVRFLEREALVPTTSCGFLRGLHRPWAVGGRSLSVAIMDSEPPVGAPPQWPMSFAQALSGSLHPQKALLPVKAPTFTDAGDPAVYFSQEEISKSEEVLQRAIIVKCSYGRPSIPEAVHNHLEQSVQRTLHAHADRVTSRVHGLVSHESLEATGMSSPSLMVPHGGPSAGDEDGVKTSKERGEDFRNEIHTRSKAKSAAAHKGWVLGDGSKISFLDDTWYGDRPLRELLPISSQEVVSPTVRDVFLDKHHPLCSYIPEDFQEVSLASFEDFPIWDATSSGKFSIKSAYELIRPYGIRRPPLLRIWHQRFSRRASLFAWLLLHRAVPVDHRITECGIPLPSRCYYCRSPQLEDLNHLFLHSDNIAKDLWSWIAPLLQNGVCPDVLVYLFFRNKICGVGVSWGSDNIPSP